MDVNNLHIGIRKIKFILVFFCVFLCFQGCTKDEKVTDINVHYEDNRGVNVQFKGNDKIRYQVVTKENTAIAILGELTAEETNITFTPVIPFTHNVNYQIRHDGRIVGEFRTKKGQLSTTPRITAIYPKLDTVPENLLKMYITFSEPMQEVRSALDFIEVIDLTTQEKTHIFLPLETELWNTEHTELTLWLDPGRIKKDLIPNKELGIPIKKGHSYAIRILSDWQSAQGMALGKITEKKIVVGSRDATSPSIAKWSVTAPTKDTKEGLGISFDESLDAMLIEKNIRIVHEKNGVVPGGFLVMKNASSVLFVPKDVWKKGRYQVSVESSLEDMAGNNLNRLFDTDLQQKQALPNSKTQHISFTIQ